MSAIATTLERTRLGTPQQRRNLTTFPIHFDLSPSFGAPDYVPLGQAIENGTAVITEISEGGSVPTLAVHNAGDAAVFILDGEELIGARQNRIVNLSILVPPKSVLPIPVSCVERGRWSYRTREFRQSPNAMFAAGRARKMSAVNESLRASGARDADQHDVWEAVAGYSRMLGAPSPTESMNDVYDKKRASVDQYLDGLEPEGGQVGAVFAVNGRVAGAELFESPELFAAYFPKIVRSYALDALLVDTHPQTSPEDAGLLLDELRRADGKRFPAIGLGEDLRIEHPGIVGAALLLDDRLVHLAAFRPAAAA